MQEVAAVRGGFRSPRGTSWFWVICANDNTNNLDEMRTPDVYVLFKVQLKDNHITSTDILSIINFFPPPVIIIILVLFKSDASLACSRVVSVLILKLVRVLADTLLWF